MVIEKQRTRILERCKATCFREIAFCTYIPEPHTPPPDSSSYGINLLDQLIQSQVEGACAKFRDLIKLVSYFHASSHAHQDDNGELQVVTPELLKHCVSDSNPTAKNILYDVTLSFSDYLQEVWNFLFSPATSMVDPDTHQFHSPEDIANILWRCGQCAKEFFFDCTIPFSTQGEIAKALDCYKEIVASPDKFYSPKPVLFALTKLLTMLMILIFHRVALDTAFRVMNLSTPLPQLLHKYHYEPTPQ